MAGCEIPGHPDSYGLGIRVAFYLQWFGIITTSWILPSDALNLKFLNGLTTAATAVGLAINIGVLQPAEILVVLLLVCGTLYFFMPIYLWRLSTLCRQWWNPELWPKVKLGSLFKTGLFLMSGALLCLQLWYWTTGVHGRPSPSSASSGTSSSCPQYGFLFAQVRLDNVVLITFNIALHFIMLIVGAWVFACWVGLFDGCRWYRKRKRERWRTTPRRIRTLQEFRTMSDVTVASVTTAAVELVIAWNNISGVNNLDTAAQLIPVAISAAYLTRSFYLWVVSGPTSPGAYPYYSGTNTATGDSHRGRSQGRGRPRVLYFRPGGDWTRRSSRRFSHHSHRHDGRRSRRTSAAAMYDDHYMPEMTTTPSVPRAVYTQQYQPVSVADAPMAGEV